MDSNNEEELVVKLLEDVTGSIVPWLELDCWLEVLNEDSEVSLVDDGVEIVFEFVVMGSTDELLDEDSLIKFDDWLTALEDVAVGDGGDVIEADSVLSIELEESDDGVWVVSPPLVGLTVEDTVESVVREVGENVVEEISSDEELRDVSEEDVEVVERGEEELSSPEELCSVRVEVLRKAELGVNTDEEEG